MRSFSFTRSSSALSALRRRGSARAALTLIALAATSCGGGGGGGSVAFDELPDRYAAAACDHFEQCFDPLSEVFAGGDCAQDLALQLEDSLMPLWRAAIDAGTLSYDPSAAGDCVRDLRNLPCDAEGPRGTACDDALRGTVEAGGTCSSHEECAGDAYCDFDASCPGECRPRGAAGASCNDDDACTAGLECLDDVCAAPSTLGSPCEDDDACGGLTTCIAGRCATVRESLTASLGETCDPEAGVLCEEGTSCALEGFDPATETAQWRCVAPSSSGGACKLGLPDPCPNDEYCDADPATTFMFDGTCQPLPAAGEACRAGGDFAVRRCADGLVCSDGVCRGVQRLGASCGSDRECYSGNCESDVCAVPSCAP